jgi:hypothetical protein
LGSGKAACLPQGKGVCYREREIADLVDIYSAMLRKLELPHWAILVSFIFPITQSGMTISSTEFGVGQGKLQREINYTLFMK